MKALALALLVVAAAGCSTDDKDTPEVVAKKEQCRKLIGHMFEISPETRGQNVDELIKKVPVEDIEQCVVADAKVMACLGAAPDLDAVKACIPPPKE